MKDEKCFRQKSFTGSEASVFLLGVVHLSMEFNESITSSRSCYLFTQPTQKKRILFEPPFAPPSSLNKLWLVLSRIIYLHCFSPRIGLKNLFHSRCGRWIEMVMMRKINTGGAKSVIELFSLTTNGNKSLICYNGL